MTHHLFRSTALALGLLAASSSSFAADPVRITIAAINDLHGNLEPTTQDYRQADGSTARLHYGGIATLGAMLDAWRSKDPDLLLVGAGDLVGASPAASSLWADEPVFEALKALGMVVSSAGNHEFDPGRAELRRQIAGGCESPRPGKACQLRGSYAGSGFPYIAANLIDTSRSERLLPAYHVVHTKGVKVAFVGAVPRELAQVVKAKSLAGLEAQDEADAINQVIPELKAQGVNAIIAVMHQGGATPEPYTQRDCAQLSGPIVDVAQRLDPAVDAVISGHSHQSYQCKVGERSITQAGKYGHFMTQLTLDVTPGAHHATLIDAVNHPVDPQAYPPNAAMSALLADVRERSRQKLLQPVGRIAVAELTRTLSPGGDTPLGNLVTDAQLAMTRPLGAQIAFTNMGGLRADLFQQADAPLSYEQLFAVQPFANSLVLLDLSGEQLLRLLEQQWAGGSFSPLQISGGFHYQWDAQRPAGSRVLPESLTLEGKAIVPSASYRVVANAFLAEGGNVYSVFKEGKRREETALLDLDALVGYLRQSNEQGITPGRWDAPRATRLN